MAIDEERERERERERESEANEGSIQLISRIAFARIDRLNGMIGLSLNAGEFCIIRLA